MFQINVAVEKSNSPEGQQSALVRLKPKIRSAKQVPDQIENILIISSSPTELDSGQKTLWCHSEAEISPLWYEIPPFHNFILIDICVSFGGILHLNVWVLTSFFLKGQNNLWPAKSFIVHPSN